jgi:hypothetical protein
MQFVRSLTVICILFFGMVEANEEVVFDGQVYCCLDKNSEEQLWQYLGSVRLQHEYL